MSQLSTRRAFLRAAAVTPFALARTLHAAERGQARRVPVIDTHIHCFAGARDKRFPYHARAPYRPEPAATPEHLLRCMDDAGVNFAVIVHPEPYQDDHRYLEHCLAAGKGRLKGTCLVFADRPGSVDQLAGLVKKLAVVTVRIHAYAPDRLPPFGKRELRDLWARATDLGLAVQLHLEPRYAPQFEPYLKEFANARVIIDHLGRPFQGTPQEHAVIVRWSRYKNTHMKLSSIPEKRQYPHRDIAPIIKELVNAYGAERMIWGGGYSAEATGKSYRTARERARGYIAFLSQADQEKVLGGTAARLFRFA
ncbi:MAG: amidohydrolase [Gemmataceae bacterium]|nr:amidohydrolase [Gemmataceae bacterium]